MWEIIIEVVKSIISWFRKSYLQGPELTIEIVRDGGNSAPLGFSNKNIPDADGVIEMRDALQIFRLTWNLNIVIRNNSEYTAYYPKIFFANQQSPFAKVDRLNDQESITSNAKVILSAVYQELEEAKGTERNKMVDLPPVIKEMEILLEYKNASKSVFYTLYKNIDKTNAISKKKPKHFS